MKPRKKISKKLITAIGALYGDNPLPPKKFTFGYMDRATEPQVKPKVPLESEEQAKLVAELHRRNIMVMAIPNAGKRTPWGGYRERAQGLLAGAPDLFLPVPSKRYHGLFIEMKRQIGGILTAQQRDCMASLNRAGYVAVVARGYDAAIKIVEDYVNDC